MAFAIKSLTRIAHRDAMTFRAIVSQLTGRNFFVFIAVGLCVALNLYGQLDVGGDAVDMKGRVRSATGHSPEYMVGWPFTYATILKKQWFTSRSTLTYLSIRNLFYNLLTAACLSASVAIIGGLRRRFGAKRALSTIDVAILFLFIAVGCSWWVNEGRKHLTELAVDENLQKYGAGLGFDDCSPTAVSRIVPKRFLARFVRATELYCGRDTNDNAVRAVIADVRALSSLNELDLSESSITDDGLGEIVRGRRLNIINVSDTQIVGTGLAELEPDCLHELVAENSAFNDRGMKSIKSQERLFEINVKNCPVSDVGLERIERCSGLGWILLGGTEISDKSVDGVLRGFKNAHYISLKNVPGISSGSVERLRRALPFTTVVSP